MSERQAVSIVLDLSGEVMPITDTLRFSIPGGAEITLDQAKLLLNQLQLGPHDSEGVLEVRIETLPSVEAFIRARIEDLVRRAANSSERAHLCGLLERKLAELQQLGLLDK